MRQHHEELQTLPGLIPLIGLAATAAITAGAHVILRIKKGGKK